MEIGYAKESCSELQNKDLQTDSLTLRVRNR